MINPKHKVGDLVLMRFNNSETYLLGQIDRLYKQHYQILWTDGFRDTVSEEIVSHYKKELKKYMNDGLKDAI
jgi:hypothetical protein